MRMNSKWKNMTERPRSKKERIKVGWRQKTLQKVETLIRVKGRKYTPIITLFKIVDMQKKENMCNLFLSVLNFLSISIVFFGLLPLSLLSLGLVSWNSKIFCSLWFFLDYNNNVMHLINECPITNVILNKISQ